MSSSTSKSIKQTLIPNFKVGSAKSSQIYGADDYDRICEEKSHSKSKHKKSSSSSDHHHHHTISGGALYLDARLNFNPVQFEEQRLHGQNQNQLDNRLSGEYIEDQYENLSGVEENETQNTTTTSTTAPQANGPKSRSTRSRSRSNNGNNTGSASDSNTTNANGTKQRNRSNTSKTVSKKALKKQENQNMNQNQSNQNQNHCQNNTNANSKNKNRSTLNYTSISQHLLDEGEDDTALFQNDWVNDRVQRGAGAGAYESKHNVHNEGAMDRVNTQKYASKINLEPIRFGGSFDQQAKNSMINAESKVNQSKNIGISQDSRATVQQCLDKYTFSTLHKFFNNGVFESVHGCISTGKEANVYYANTKKSAQEIFGEGTADLNRWKKLMGLDESSVLNVCSSADVKNMESDSESSKVQVGETTTSTAVTEEVESPDITADAVSSSIKESESKDEESHENPTIALDRKKVCFNLEESTTKHILPIDHSTNNNSTEIVDNHNILHENLNYQRAPLIAKGYDQSNQLFDENQEVADQLLQDAREKKLERERKRKEQEENSPYKKNKTGFYSNKDKANRLSRKNVGDEDEEEVAEIPVKNNNSTTVTNLKSKNQTKKSILKDNNKLNNQETTVSDSPSAFSDVSTAPSVSDLTLSESTNVNNNLKIDLAVKIFKTAILVFKDRARYTEGDYRFRSGCTRGNPRKMVQLWCEKESRNLKRINQKAKLIKSPIPIDHRNNVLVMTLIGKSGIAAPRLKDVKFEDDEDCDSTVEQSDNEIQTNGGMSSGDDEENERSSNGVDAAGNTIVSNETSSSKRRSLKTKSQTGTATSTGQRSLRSKSPSKQPLLTAAERWDSLYLHCCRLVRDLFKNVGLVHGDLSEYNLLYYNSTIYMIDVSQAVESDHPQALDFLKRDCQNVNSFFSRHGVAVMSLRTLYRYVTMDGTNINVSEIRDKYLEERQEREQKAKECRDEAERLLNHGSSSTSGTGPNNAALLLRRQKFHEREQQYLAREEEDESVFKSTWVPSNLHQISDLAAMDRDMDKLGRGDTVLCSELLAPSVFQKAKMRMEEDSSDESSEASESDSESDCDDLKSNSTKKSKNSHVGSESSKKSTNKKKDAKANGKKNKRTTSDDIDEFDESAPISNDSKKSKKMKKSAKLSEDGTVTVESKSTKSSKSKSSKHKERLLHSDNSDIDDDIINYDQNTTFNLTTNNLKQIIDLDSDSDFDAASVSMSDFSCSQSDHSSSVKERSALMERKEQKKLELEANRAEKNQKQAEKWRKLREKKRLKHEKRLEKQEKEKDVKEKETTVKTTNNKDVLEVEVEVHESEDNIDQDAGWDLEDGDTVTEKPNEIPIHDDWDINVTHNEANTNLTSNFNLNLTDEKSLNELSDTTPKSTKSNNSSNRSNGGKTRTLSSELIPDVEKKIFKEDYGSAGENDVEEIDILEGGKVNVVEKSEVVTTENKLDSINLNDDDHDEVQSGTDHDENHRDSAHNINLNLNDDHDHHDLNNDSQAEDNHTNNLSMSETDNDDPNIKRGKKKNEKIPEGARDPNMSKAEWKAKVKDEKRHKREEKIPKSLKKKHKATKK